MSAARRSRSRASSRDSTPWRTMTSEVSTKMMTVIVFTGLAAVLLSTYTSTMNEIIIAMYGIPCTNVPLNAPGARRTAGAPRSCSRAAAASQT